jgi:hypothetical protein
VHLRSVHHELEPTHPWELWYNVFAEVDKKTGLAFNIAPQLKGWMEEAGFVNIVETISKCAIGMWPKDKKQKELGAWNQLRIDMGMRDFGERRLKTVLNVSFTIF